MSSSPVPEHSIDFPQPRRDIYLPPAARARSERRTKYIILFALTVVTTTLAGANYYAGFLLDFGTRPLSLTVPQMLANGLLWYALPALLILGAHEFGHYFACRYYGVEASLPYFLPIWLPVPVQFGTLGAVIRIRQPIHLKRQLFDIGIAGPIAGFLVIVPVLLIGFSLSRVVPMPPEFAGLDMGEPLIFQGLERLLVGPVPAGYEVNVHPMGWAGWFGLLATALNLVPIGQLDGGHISYAVLGRRSVFLTVVVVLGLIGLSVVSGGSYALWTGLIVVMLFIFGLHHPRVIDEDAPLDTARLVLALIAALIFVLSFTPIPARLIGL